MSDLSYPDTRGMSCPFLGTLAPETRAIIYEYVLSFDTPVKHATNLQPFLQKLTGGKSNPETADKHATNPQTFEEPTVSGSTPEPEDTEAANESDWESIDEEDESDLQTPEQSLSQARAQRRQANQSHFAWSTLPS